MLDRHTLNEVCANKCALITSLKTVISKLSSYIYIYIYIYIYVYIDNIRENGFVLIALFGTIKLSASKRLILKTMVNVRQVYFKRSVCSHMCSNN